MYMLLFLMLASTSSFVCTTTEQEQEQDLAELEREHQELVETVYTRGNCSRPEFDRVYQHNERIEFGDAWFKCEHEIVMGPLGCISNGVDIELKTIYMEGRYQYQCTDTVGKKLVGCTTKAGGTDTVEVDGEFDDDGLRYVCKADKGIGILGCLDSTGESTVLIEYEDTYISKVITLDEEKGTSIKVFGQCSVDEAKTGLILVEFLKCKLYKGQDVVSEISAGCSAVVDEDGQEKIFHCGTSAVGSNEAGIADRQADEIMGCSS